MPIVIGAGITEQWYFSHLKELHGYRIKVRPRFFGTETADGLSKKIKEVLEDGGTVICVFDADVSTWNDAEKEKLKLLRIKYQKNKKVLLCDSMPSIEYWFLLHYEETNCHLGTSQAAIRRLRKHIPGFEKKERFLRQIKWVEEMSGGGKQDAARERAEHFGSDCESYSKIHLALERIESNPD